MRKKCKPPLMLSIWKKNVAIDYAILAIEMRVYNMEYDTLNMIRMKFSIYGYMEYKIYGI